MSDLLAFGETGFRHILDPGAIDHLLFLVALAAGYRLPDWRDALRVVTAFTIGHSLTLALAATGAMELPTPLIEFLIPLTILATGVANLAGSAPGARGRVARWQRPAAAGGFGLVHGAGFASYLRSLFLDDVALPLLGFNLGIETAQVLVLAAAALALALLDRLTTHRVRVVAVSAAVLVLAARMAVERSPW